MKLPLILATALLLSLLSTLAETSEDELKLGVAAYQENRYEQAIQHFEEGYGTRRQQEQCSSLSGDRPCQPVHSRRR